MAGKAELRRVVQSIRDGAWTLQQEFVPCGKRNCSRCPHGPYWYGYIWAGGKKRAIYIGKDLMSWAMKKGPALLERARKIAEMEDVRGDDDDAGSLLLQADEQDAERESPVIGKGKGAES